LIAERANVSSTTPGSPAAGRSLAQLKYYDAIKGCFDCYAGAGWSWLRMRWCSNIAPYGYNAIALPALAKQSRYRHLETGGRRWQQQIRNAASQCKFFGPELCVTFPTARSTSCLAPASCITSITATGAPCEAGGVVLFTETLGHNPAIEYYRKNPEARTPGEHRCFWTSKFDWTFDQTESGSA
jgi:hypothetical protein